MGTRIGVDVKFDEGLPIAAEMAWDFLFSLLLLLLWGEYPGGPPGGGQIRRRGGGPALRRKAFAPGLVDEEVGSPDECLASGAQGVGVSFWLHLFANNNIIDKPRLT